MTIGIGFCTLLSGVDWGEAILEVFGCYYEHLIDSGCVLCALLECRDTKRFFGFLLWLIAVSVYQRTVFPLFSTTLPRTV